MGFRTFTFIGIVALFILGINFTFFVAVDCSEFTPVVHTEQGSLKGLILKSRKGKNYFGFLGIPYGNVWKRYEDAAVPKKWKGTKLATQFGASCKQFDYISNKTLGEEQCLFLNVYTPKLTEKLAVMVFIHGGDFMSGSGDGHGAKYFMDEGVILVTINYRLASFGFLNTEDGVIQGNFGLKDQNLAFKWVNANMKYFGGDVKRITIFGQNAGGASVNYHIISAMSKGLFKNAISQSGSALNPWAFQRQPNTNAQRLGKYGNCSTEDSRVLKLCLQEKSADELINIQRKFQKWFRDPISPFGPSVEFSGGNDTDVFLSDTPYRLLSQKNLNPHNISWVIGLNENEGALFSAGVLNNPTLLRDINEKRDTIFPIAFGFEDTSKSDWSLISEKIHEFYLQGKLISEENLKEFTNLFSDRNFNHGVKVAANLYAKNGHGYVFPYIFTYKGNFSYSSILNPYAPFYRGVAHMDELQYLFNYSLSGFKVPEFPKDSDSFNFSVKFVRLWVSIAQFGIPAKIWGPEDFYKPMRENEFSGGAPMTWYRIDTKTKRMRETFTSRMKFWDNLQLNEMENEKLYHYIGKDEL